MLDGSGNITEPTFGRYTANAVLLRLIGVTDLSTPHPLTGWRRKVVKRYLRWTGKLYDVVYRDLRLRLKPSENAGDLQIVMHGQHAEEAEFDVFANEASAHSVFVDIGANIGLYSLLATRHMKPDAKVIAFEPAPATRAKLERNLMLNDAGQQVQVVPAGVGPKAGSFELSQVNGWNAGQNTLVTSGNGPSIIVPVVTLKDALADHQITSIGILKIDIEGFEDQALCPFFETTDASLWPDYVMLESDHGGDWKLDLFGALEQRGYTVAFENAHNRHFRRTREAVQ